MTTLPTIDNRKLIRAPERKVRNWRIVAGLLALLVVYGWFGERDREHAALQRPVMLQQHKMIGGHV